MKIPLCIPDIDEEELKAVGKVLKSGWLAHGPKVQEFEETFAEYIGVKHASALNSCASALQLAIQAQDLHGEIILPSFTHMSSANAIINAGCTPVFADIEYGMCNIDPKKIEEKINKNSVGIMPVHFAGQSCNMKEIMRIADQHNLKVIEDSAETIGGKFDGKKTGTFGIGCFSLYPVKNMTTGEGGVITTNDDDVIKKINAYKAHGILSSTFEREKQEKPWIRAAVLAGYNYRMSDINAAIGIVQLTKLDRMNKLRREHASYYNKNLNFNGIILPVEVNNVTHVYQMYTVKVEKEISRDKFVKYLREKGIGASVHFDPPVHLQPYYRKMCHKGNLPITEEVANSIVTLPMYPQLKKEELDYVINSIEKFLKEFKG